MTIIHRHLPAYRPTEVTKEDKPFGGTIKNWEFYPNISGGFTGYGVLIKDNLKRFPRNTNIQTSNVEEFFYDTESKTGWVVTRNTRYDLTEPKENFDFGKFQEQLKNL